MTFALAIATTDVYVDGGETVLFVEERLRTQFSRCSEMGCEVADTEPDTPVETILATTVRVSPGERRTEAPQLVV